MVGMGIGKSLIMKDKIMPRISDSSWRLPYYSGDGASDLSEDTISKNHE